MIMLTPDTIRAELKRRIKEENDQLAGAKLRAEEADADYEDWAYMKRVEEQADETVEALQEFEGWIVAQMAKEAREYARQHYGAELAKHQDGEG
jgi:hypothetical protein